MIHTNWYHVFWQLTLLQHCKQSYCIQVVAYFKLCAACLHKDDLKEFSVHTCCDSVVCGDSCVMYVLIYSNLTRICCACVCILDNMLDPYFTRLVLVGLYVKFFSVFQILVCQYISWCHEIELLQRALHLVWKEKHLYLSWSIYWNVLFLLMEGQQ